MKLYPVECCSDCPAHSSCNLGTSAKCDKSGKFIPPDPDIGDFPESCQLEDAHMTSSRFADLLDEIINRLEMADGEGESETGQPLIRLSQALKIVDDIKKETPGIGDLKSR